MYGESETNCKSETNCESETNCKSETNFESETNQFHILNSNFSVGLYNMMVQRVGFGVHFRKTLVLNKNKVKLL